ncbi:MAG: asparagine synthetase B, partial [Candidatus Diapherotrites archaeon]|nr:asparagine synthetase B [Candidatus Diapherotrites archaeon]
LLSQQARGIDRLTLSHPLHAVNETDFRKLSEAEFSFAQGLAFGDTASHAGVWDDFFVDGEFFDEWPWNEFRKEISEGVPVVKAAQKLVSRARGDFAVAFFWDGVFYAFRDFLGAKPLWVGENSRFVGVASEFSALRRMDLSFPQAVPPGHLLCVQEGKWSLTHLFDVSDLRKIPADGSLDAVREALRDSVSFRVKDVKKAAVFFSGGVDSSLVARLVGDRVKKTVLFSVGLRDSSDLLAAKGVAKEMGLEWVGHEVTPLEVREVFLPVLKRLGVFDELQVQIALSEFLAAGLIVRSGFSVAFNGQGSDELFGGYSEYLEAFRLGGAWAVRERMFCFLESMATRNCFREDIVSSSFVLSNRSPLLDLFFVKSAVALPAEQKVLSASDALRKHPVRALAREFGVPALAVTRKKTAMQYGSGLSKYKKLLGL